MARRSAAVRRAAFRAGFREVGPSLAAMAAWGLVTGLAMVQVGLELLPSLALTFAVYSGTSQLAVLPLLATGTGVAAMVGAAFVANLRFVVYSAVMSRHLRRLPLGWRLLIGFFTIDGPVAAFVQRRERGPMVQRVAYLVGANTSTAMTWCASSVLGIAWATVLPAGTALAYIGVLALFAITVPMLAGRPAWAAAATSIAVALLGADWPHRLGTFVAVLAAVAVALGVQRASSPRVAPSVAGTRPPGRS
jgi:predicted branched-subunit amino acid permease